MIEDFLAPGPKDDRERDRKLIAMVKACTTPGESNRLAQFMLAEANRQHDKNELLAPLADKLNWRVGQNVRN